MPDLGKYGFEVGLAYGISALLIFGLVAWVWRKSFKVKQELREVEARTSGSKSNG